MNQPDGFIAGGGKLCRRAGALGTAIELQDAGDGRHCGGVIKRHLARARLKVGFDAEAPRPDTGKAPLRMSLQFAPNIPNNWFDLIGSVDKFVTRSNQVNLIRIPEHKIGSKACKNNPNDLLVAYHNQRGACRQRKSLHMH